MNALVKRDEPESETLAPGIVPQGRPRGQLRNYVHYELNSGNYSLTAQDSGEETQRHEAPGSPTSLSR